MSWPLPLFAIGLLLGLPSFAAETFSTKSLDKNVTEAVKIEVRNESPTGWIFLKSVRPKKKTAYFLGRFEAGGLKSFKPITANTFRFFTRSFFSFYLDPTRRRPAVADCRGAVAVNVRQLDKLLLDSSICLSAASEKDRHHFAQWYRSVKRIP